MKLLGARHPPRFPIGFSDYVDLRRSGVTYVDKTAFIADVLGSPAKVLLFPRPRRFGKTLNLSALRHFVEAGPDAETRRTWFEDTEIWRHENGTFQAFFAQNPTINLSFKDRKASTWSGLWQGLAQLLKEEVDRVAMLLEASGQPGMLPSDLSWSARVSAEATPEDLREFLRKLSGWLHRLTGKPVMILIDEYDTPLHSAWENGYWDEAMAFFRGFLSGGLKDNPALAKGVLTGILKVAKEGLFSGLNHLETATVMSDLCADRFGFTEDEVEAMAASVGKTELLPVIRRWYNGYRVGETRRETVYNPWSVILFLDSGSPNPRAFWRNTSDNALVHDLLRRHSLAIARELEALLAGQTVEVTFDEDVPLQQVQTHPSAVFSLLTYSGYLTVESIAPTEEGYRCALRIPNLEVMGVFRSTFRDWFATGQMQTSGGPAKAILDALLAGDDEAFQNLLETVLVQMFSYHDLAGDRVEAIYQAFFLGLLVNLGDRYRVLSNREAGHGRADVLIIPKTPGPGAVLELKRIGRNDTREQALAPAAAQLADRQYASEVLAAGATAVVQYAVVFDGKRCDVQRVVTPS